MSASRAILLYEASIARLVLVTLVEGTHHLGRPPSRGFVVAVLHGSISKDVVRADGHRMTTFGMLARYTRGSIGELFSALVRQGLVEKVRSQASFVCTARGRAVVEGTAEVEPLGLVAGAVDPRKLDLAVRSGLVDALRRYRAVQANAEDVPEYRVFSEATLRAIAAALPGSEDELARIPGLGEARVPAHGFDILRIVSEHEPIIERLEANRARPGDDILEPVLDGEPEPLPQRAPQ